MFSEASVPALLFMPVPNLLNTSVMSFRCWCVWSAGFCITASSVRFLCIEVGRFFQYAWGRRKSNPAASASWKLGKNMFLTSGRPTIQNSVEFFLHYVLRTTDSGPRRPSSERTMSPGRQYSRVSVLLTLQRKFLDSVVRIAISKGHWLLFAWPLSQCTQER